MTEAYEPPLESKREAIETEEQSPLIQAIKNLIENFREGVFGDKEPTVAESKPQLVEKKYKTLNNQKISDLRIFCGIKAGEFLDVEDVVAIHDTLKSQAGKEDEIEEFIGFDYSVVHKINEAHDENAKDNLILPLKEEINRLITVFVGRYLSRKGDRMRYGGHHEVKVKTKSRAAIRSLSDIRLDDEGPAETDANVIPIEKAKTAHAQQPAGKPEDNEPGPIQPKTNVA